MPPPAATPATAFPGPPVLGRGAVVRAGDPSPAALAAATRIRIDADVLAQPAAAAAVLHDHWVHRRPVVVELAVDNDAVRAPEVCDRPPYELTPDFSFDRERLHHLMWANTYDCRTGEPVWWHGVLAERRGASASDTADVRLADGTDVWVDGGPRGPLPVATVHRESVALGRLTPLGGALPADDLAPDQLAAVRHESGPARVIAPAGSGKTRVLTARLRHLLRDRGYEPELVTAVAYNTRAAAEMRERVVASGVRGANIRTLHSLAFWICGLEGRRDVLAERDVRGILDRFVRTARIPNQDPFQPYLEALSEVRLALRDPEAVEAERDDVDGLAELFPRYREELDRRNALDFDEQIYRALELLLTRPDIRREVQRRCTHLLVDEFQDLTPAFMLLVRLAASPSLQVFGVGDDDQVIYSYAGATPDYLIEFDRYFPGAAHHALEVNYRCPPPVVASAVTLLGHNRRRVPKVIHPAPDRAGDRGEGDEAGRGAGGERGPEVHAVAPGAMSERTVAIVRDWLEDGLAPRDVAVLARVNAALLPVQVALANAGIARTAPLDASVLGRTGIRTALAYLRIGLDPERIRREDVWDTINRPARKVKSAVEPFLQRERSWSMERLHAVADALDGRAAERFGEYLGDLQTLTDAITEGADTERCLWVIRNRIGLGEAMEALDSSTTRPEGSSHGDDLDALEQLAALHADPVTFREWLVEALRIEGDEDGVHLSTIHRVKGMEWDRVVVFAANQGLMPHRLAEETEEERRVFHVALTRCRDEVAIVGNRDALSPYVEELRRAADRTPRDRAKASVVPELVRPTTRADGRVVAEPGVAVTLAGGFDGRVVAVEGEEAVVRLAGDVDVRVALGAPLEVAGERTSLARPARVTTVGAPRLAGTGAGEVADTPEVEAMFERLRDWRTRTAQAQGMPAYIVLHDNHLREIARRQPRNVRELAGCPGIGPTKLEKYADDILAIVDA